jgi:hypothetical protein
MEKQLLFLLDWDLRINPEDLYYHLEPFLAPIRVWQARQAEKARLAEKEKEVARQYQLCCGECNVIYSAMVLCWVKLQTEGIHEKL